MKVMFFSYKGGVGRTTSLVNTGFVLGHKLGHRVGLVDLDFEAPSMHAMLNLEPKKHQSILYALRSRDTIFFDNRAIDLLELYSERLGDARRGAHLSVYPCLPDPEFVNQLFDNDEDAVYLFEELMESYHSKNALDYSLMDARSGYALHSALADTLADKVVLVFRLDEQNMMGIRDIIRNYGGGKDIVLVANEVPQLPQAKEHIQRFEDGIGSSIDIVIPLYEELLFGTRIPYLDYGIRHPLLTKYEELAGLIVGH